MIRTYQRTSTIAPQGGNRNLGLMVACGNCPAARIFKIDAVFEALKNRETAGFIIETECEKCGHLIAVTIGWIDVEKPGYSYRKMEFSPEESVVTVSDENGLKMIE